MLPSRSLPPFSSPFSRGAATRVMSASGSEYSVEIPEGETRQVSRDTFKKHLPAVAFSHYESREEVILLDYTPCINRKYCVTAAL